MSAGEEIDRVVPVIEALAGLTARMIDRPIRPLWPKGFKNEVQCIATVLSADMVTPHDILCINGVDTNRVNTDG